MSRKVCRRRHYALVNPIQCAIEGAAIAQPELLDRLRLVELSAIESFAKGQATPADWRAVADFAAWARDPTRIVDVTADADAIEVEIDTRDAGTVTATIPRAVLVELLRRTSK